MAPAARYVRHTLLLGAIISIALLATPVVSGPNQVHERQPALQRLARSAVAVAPAAAQTTEDPAARVQRALDELVSGDWRAATPVRIEIIEGQTSWSATDGTIRMSRYHAEGTWAHLRAVLGHEWGHQVAFRYGTQRRLGAPPEGFPGEESQAPEAWASCVSRVLTNDGQDPASACADEPLYFTASWLASGPP
jgi:hypothetical protein